MKYNNQSWDEMSIDDLLEEVQNLALECDELKKHEEELEQQLLDLGQVPKNSQELWNIIENNEEKHNTSTLDSNIPMI